MEYEYHNIEIDILDGFGYVRITQKETGLPYDIILDSYGIPKNMITMPHLGVVVEGLVVPVLIDEKPQILTDYDFVDASIVFNWILKHHKALLQHWNKEVTDREILNKVVDC